MFTAKHPAVQLLSERAHRGNLHEGTEYVRNMLQQEYWIIGLRNALRKIKSRCIKCRHRNANPIHPPMADLPRERLDEHVFPFTHSSFDYFGLLEVKLLRRTLKRWCCLFTSNNESSSHRSRTVIGHRVTSSCSDKIHCKTWLPKNHHQRQQKNFVGAAKELKALINEWDKAKIESALAQSTWSPTLWWNLGKTGSKLQHDHD